MVCRPPHRVSGAPRLVLTALSLFLLLAAAAVPESRAATRGFPTDYEGDPGDGVLDPRADETPAYDWWTRPGSSSDGGISGTDVKDPTFDIVLVPVAAAPGAPWPVTFRVVRVHSRVAFLAAPPDLSAYLYGEGRWQHAP
jgi:hypothetical protein